MSFDEGLYVGYADVNEPAARLFGSPCDMRCEEGMWLTEQWIVSLGRLLFHDIGTVCGQMSVGKRLGHSLLVNQCSTDRKSVV